MVILFIALNLQAHEDISLSVNVKEKGNKRTDLIHKEIKKKKKQREDKEKRRVFFAKYLINSRS